MQTIVQLMRCVYLSDMNAWRRILTITVFLFLGFVQHCVAQDRVEFHDSTLHRGLHVIPLYATFSVADGDSVSLTVSFDPNLVDISEVSSPILGIRISNFSSNINGVHDGTFQVSFHAPTLRLNNQVLLNFSVNLLAGSDSVTSLKATSISRNSQAWTQVQSIAGIMHMVDAPPTTETVIEYLFIGPPHPSDAPLMKFYVIQKDDVHFTLFDVIGREILTETLRGVEKGPYQFRFQSADYYRLCDACYFVRMVTSNGVYIQQMIVEH